jgi:hypothetical protein
MFVMDFLGNRGVLSLNLVPSVLGLILEIAPFLVVNQNFL